jgi:hypothetical protein
MWYNRTEKNVRTLATSVTLGIYKSKNNWVMRSRSCLSSLFRLSPPLTMDTILGLTFLSLQNCLIRGRRTWIIEKRKQFCVKHGHKGVKIWKLNFVLRSLQGVGTQELGYVTDLLKPTLSKDKANAFDLWWSFMVLFESLLAVTGCIMDTIPLRDCILVSN